MAGVSTKPEGAPSAPELKQQETTTKVETNGRPTARRMFPSGSKALFRIDEKGMKVPLEETDMVTLINLSLSSGNVRVPDDSIKPKKDGGFYEKQVDILPLGQIVMPVASARKLFACQEKDGGIPKFVMVPLDGDCHGKEGFQAYGRQWDSCPYGNCKTHGSLPPRVRWSIWQGQHLVGRLGSEIAIKRFVEEFDQRTSVMLYGLEQINRRAMARAERMGLTSSKNRGDVVH